MAPFLLVTKSSPPSGGLRKRYLFNLHDDLLSQYFTSFVILIMVHVVKPHCSHIDTLRLVTRMFGNIWLPCCHEGIRKFKEAVKIFLEASLQLNDNPFWADMKCPGVLLAAQSYVLRDGLISSFQSTVSLSDEFSLLSSMSASLNKRRKSYKR